jgi:hypothetical protein
VGKVGVLGCGVVGQVLADGLLGQGWGHAFKLLRR